MGLVARLMFVVLLCALMTPPAVGLGAEAGEDSGPTRHAGAGRWTPIQLALSPDLGIFPRTWEVRGLRLGLTSKNRRMSGLDLNWWLGSSKDSSSGVGLAPFLGGDGDGNGLFASLMSQFGGRARGVVASGLFGFAMDGVDGVQLSGLSSIASEFHLPYNVDTRGVQAAALASITSGRMKGIQLALLNSARRLTGLQLGFFNAGGLAGDCAQLGGVNFLSLKGYRNERSPFDFDTGDGMGEPAPPPGTALQFGAFNSAVQHLPIKGAQFGGINWGAVEGAQLGVANIANSPGQSSGGLQLGVFNNTIANTGLQLGLINRSNHRRGLRIGLINLREGKLGWPLVDW